MRRTAVIALAALALWPAAAAAGCYPRYYGYSYSYPTYSYPTYYAQPVYYPSYYPVAYPTPVCTDYAASVRDYFRDSLLADSIAFRLLTGRASLETARGRLPSYGAGDGPADGGSTAGAPPPQSPRSATPAAAPAKAPPARPPSPEADVPSTMPEAASAVPVRTNVSAALASFVKGSCVQCHGPGKAEKGLRLDGDRLAALPAGVRWQCFGKCVAKEMPKGGSEPTEKELALLYRWADDGSRAEAAARGRRAEAPSFRRLDMRRQRDALARGDDD